MTKDEQLSEEDLTILLGFFTSAIRHHCKESETTIYNFLNENIPAMDEGEVRDLGRQFLAVEHEVLGQISE